MEEKESEEIENKLKIFSDVVDAYQRTTEELQEVIFAISNRFGSANECAICNKNKRHDLGEHVFVAKIPIPINYIDEVPFSSEEFYDETFGNYKVEHHLVVENLELKYREIKLFEGWKGRSDTKDFVYIPLYAFKNLVRSGRIYKFLENIAGKLKEKYADYKKIVEIAEKIKVALLS